MSETITLPLRFGEQPNNDGCYFAALNTAPLGIDPDTVIKLIETKVSASDRVWLQKAKKQRGRGQWVQLIFNGRRSLRSSVEAELVLLLGSHVVDRRLVASEPRLEGYTNPVANTVSVESVPEPAMDRLAIDPVDTSAAETDLVLNQMDRVPLALDGDVVPFGLILHLPLFGGELSLFIQRGYLNFRWLEAKQ